MPVGDLSQTLLERDLVLLQHYAAKRMLPAARLELYLAQVSLLIAKTMGGNVDAKLDDFVFRVREPAPQTDADLGAAVLAGIAGRKVIRLQKKEKGRTP